MSSSEGEVHEEAPEATSLGVQPKIKKPRRKRHRVRKTNNWKPYSQLTWEERRDLEEKDIGKPDITVPAVPLAPDGTIPADVDIRDYRPHAPRNTTAQLIERHTKDESDYDSEEVLDEESKTQAQIESLLLEGTGSNADLIRGKRLKPSLSAGSTVRQSPRISPRHHSMEPPPPKRKSARVDSLFSNPEYAELARELRSPSSSALHPPPNYRRRKTEVK